MRVIGKLRQAFNEIISLLFPKQCACCGELIDEEEKLCDICYNTIRRIDSSKRCIICGNEKPYCDCRRYTYHFEGCVAPFVNTEAAKSALYRFKFARREQIANFFAEEIALCIKNEYRDIAFDAICFVPISFKAYRKRGFNQSKELAVGISKILKIKRVSALRRLGGGKPQHKTKLNKRFDNARGKYRAVKRLDGKTVLLIDDIKTTGATLDECSRQLLFAGAKHVFAATALVTMHINDKNKKQDKG